MLENPMNETEVGQILIDNFPQLLLQPPHGSVIQQTWHELMGAEIFCRFVGAIHISGGRWREDGIAGDLLLFVLKRAGSRDAFLTHGEREDGSLVHVDRVGGERGSKFEIKANLSSIIKLSDFAMISTTFTTALNFFNTTASIAYSECPEGLMKNNVQ